MPNRKPRPSADTPSGQSRAAQVQPRTAATAGPAGTPGAARLGSGAAIRAAAAALFLERGYPGTSMDNIAAAARVSKQTIYTHFADKEELFAELVLGNAGRVEEFLSTMARVVDEADGPKEALGALARAYIRFVIRPDVLQMRRLVVGEAGRFPELARSYYERVPQRVYATLAGLLQAMADQGHLHLDDAGRAAQHLAWLVLGARMDEGMFCGTSSPGAPEELDREADDAVRVFLAAYGTERGRGRA